MHTRPKHTHAVLALTEVKRPGGPVWSGRPRASRREKWSSTAEARAEAEGAAAAAAEEDDAAADGAGGGTRGRRPLVVARLLRSMAPSHSDFGVCGTKMVSRTVRGHFCDGGAVFFSCC